MRTTLHLAVLSTVLLTCSSVEATNRAAGSDLERILARQQLVVALIASDYPPLFMSNQSGQLSGHDVALVRHLAQSLGVRATFVRTAQSFDQVIDLVKRGEADIGLGTSLTLSRAKAVLFSQPYMTLKMALLVNRLGLIDAGVTAQLTALDEIRQTTQKIGLLMGSAYKDYARKIFPQAQLMEYRSLSELYAALEGGELLAAVRNDLTAILYLQQHPASVIRLQLFIDEAHKDHVAFAVRPDSPHLRFWLNAYLMLEDRHRTSTEVLESYRNAGQSP